MLLLSLSLSWSPQPKSKVSTFNCISLEALITFYTLPELCVWTNLESLNSLISAFSSKALEHTLQASSKVCPTTKNVSSRKMKHLPKHSAFRHVRLELNHSWVRGKSPLKTKHVALRYYLVEHVTSPATLCSPPRESDNWLTGLAANILIAQRN